MQLRRKHTRFGRTLTSCSLAAVIAGALALTGCGASDGAEADWQDFPGVYGVSSQAVLAGPVASEVPERSSAMLDALTDAYSAAYGVQVWSTSGTPIWSKQESNGYGGESLLQMYNSEQFVGESQIDKSDWVSVLELAADVLQPYGLATPGAPVVAEDSWVANAMYTSGAEWINVAVQDLRHNEAALSAAEANGWLIAGVTLSYGITTVGDDDRDEFERRSATFEGILQPPPNR